MTDIHPKIANRASDLKDAFDHSFTVPNVHANTEYLDFIAFRCRKSLFALPLADLLALERAKKTISVPGQKPFCQGLTSLRGMVIPVFSLSKILFNETADDGKDTDSGWLAVCRREDCLAFGFGGFEGHLRIARDEIYSSAKDLKANYARGTFRVAGKSGVIVDIPQVLEVVTRATSAGP